MSEVNAGSVGADGLPAPAATTAAFRRLQQWMSYTLDHYSRCTKLEFVAPNRAQLRPTSACRRQRLLSGGGT